MILATGDYTRNRISQRLPLDQVYTDLKPDVKFELVENCRKQVTPIFYLLGMVDSAALTLYQISVVMNECRYF